MSNAANFATSQNDYLLLYTETVIPQCETVIQGPLNRMVFEPLGVTFVFNPRRLEIMQRYELEKAQAISILVGRPILTVNEGRDMLELPPLVDQPAEPAKPDPVVTPPVDADAEPTDDTQAKRIVLDLERWQRKSINALERGKSAAVVFASDAIPAPEHARIAAVLLGCKTVDDVRAAFAGKAVATDYAPLIDALRDAAAAARGLRGVN